MPILRDLNICCFIFMLDWIPVEPNKPQKGHLSIWRESDSSNVHAKLLSWVNYSNFAKDHSHVIPVQKYFESMYLINCCSDSKLGFS